MNKKLFTVAALFVSVLSGSMFTSCLSGDDDDNETLAQGYFTVDGSATQIILHQDGGGTVIPAVSSLASPSEFIKNERYILQFKYRKGDISADGLTVTGAQVLAGEKLDVHNLLTTALAEQVHLSDADSLFAVSSISHIWAYRGYLNVLAKAYYSITKENKGIFPTYNMMFDPVQDVQPNRVNLTLLYNRHSKKDATIISSPSTYELATSFRLSQLSALVPGNDSIEMTIHVQGIDKPAVVKVGRTDLQKGNY